MANVATTLLEYILDLLRDEETAAAFVADPEAALEEAGLGDICSADVEAILPMLVDFAPGGMGGGFEGVGGGDEPGPSGGDGGGGGDEDEERPQGGGRPEGQGDAPDSVLAIEHVKYIQQHYTYNEENNLDFSDSVWGDSIRVWAEDESVVAVNGVALGEDAEVQDSFDGAFHEYGDDNAIGDGSIAGGDGNDAIGEKAVAAGDVDGEGHAIGGEARVDNSTDLDVRGSFNGSGNSADEGSSVVYAPDAGSVDTDSGSADEGGVVADEIAFELDYEETEIDVGDVALGSVVDSPDGVNAGGDVVQTGEVDEGVVGTLDVGPNVIVLPLADGPLE